MTATASPTARAESVAAPTSRAVLIAAGTFPIMIFGGFALLSGLAVAAVLIGSLRDARLRLLGWWNAALLAAYVTPLALWLLGSNDAPSLTKSMSPAVTAIVGGIGVVVAVVHYLARRRSAR